MNPSSICYSDELAYSGLLVISGNGSEALLQGQLTCHLSLLQNNESCLGAHCNRTGKVISLFWLSRKDDTFHLNMPQELITITEHALKKYAVFYRDVIFTNMSDSLTLSPTPLTRIRAGLPALYPETSGQFFSHELNLSSLGAIHFEKGCYTGQEIIARMHYRGKPKMGLRYIYSSHLQPLIRGQDIYGSRGACGKIVDYAQTKDYRSELLITAPLSSLDTIFIDENQTLPLEWA